MSPKTTHTVKHWSVLGLILGAWSCKPNNNPEYSALTALRMDPANARFPSGTQFAPQDVASLLKDAASDNLQLVVNSTAAGNVEEPSLPPEVIKPLDLDALGYGTTQFLVDSRWATVRFVGSAPAGAGLSGEAQNKAQLEALGTSRDSIPVVTAAWTITKIMQEYFAPLLETLPGGKEMLPHIKIQGAYFAPTSVPRGDIAPSQNNAFMVGLQSLYIWPSSCLKNVTVDCKAPYMSTGHDPTVIGHEVSHAVFNHLRKGKSLDGFQFTAANEGFADYFSAAFFSEPVIGRTWKVGKATEPYLRTVSGNATAEDEALAQEAHQFGIVWSSTLWKIRNRLITEIKARPFEIDRVMLNSIVYLGESERLRLGDSATAVLKSAEALDKTTWKPIMRQEFQNAKIALTQMGATHYISDADSTAVFSKQGVAAAPKKQSESSTSSSCGVIANGESSTSGWLVILPLLAPLVYGIRSWQIQKKTSTACVKARIGKGGDRCAS